MTKIDNLTQNETRLKRLRYRSWHRGTKESDLILGRFSDHGLEKLDEAQLGRYERLLDENDADIWDWITGKTPPKPEYAALLKLLAGE